MITQEEVVIRDEFGRMLFARRVTEQQPALPGPIIRAAEDTILTVVPAVIWAAVILLGLFILAQFA